MLFSDGLNDQLSGLSEALDHAGTDLQALLEVLAKDLFAAVSSALGVTMTLQMDGVPVTLTAIDEDLALLTGASLAFPLVLPPGAGTGAHVVFYARNPGAFVDLAADIQRLQGLKGRIVLDDPLPSVSQRPPRSGITGLTELSDINLAIGVLISLGHTPAEARAELHRRAAATRTACPMWLGRCSCRSRPQPDRLSDTHPDRLPTSRHGSQPVGGRDDLSPRHQLLRIAVGRRDRP